MTISISTPKLILQNTRSAYNTLIQTISTLFHSRKQIGNGKFTLALVLAGPQVTA